MRRLRTASTRHILAALRRRRRAGAAAPRSPRPRCGGASAAARQAARRRPSTTPPAPPPSPACTARIHFTNNLLPSGSLPQGVASPLITGADGRLWLSGDGRVRLELQSDAGDAQIVSDGRAVMVYDASSNTAYTGALPQDKTASTAEHGADARRHRQGAGQRSAGCGRCRARSRARRRAARATRCASRPRTTAGCSARPRSRGTPRNGVPLRAAIYARGQATPVLELAATHISYGVDPGLDVRRRRRRPREGRQISARRSLGAGAAGSASPT